MDEVQARLEPGSLRRLVQASRTWEAAARTEMRKGLRAAASVGAEAAKASVQGPPPARLRGAGRLAYRNATTRTTGLRKSLAGGVKVSIRTGRESKSGNITGEGVRVAATGSKLPADKQAMVKAYMAREFRHPVFGTGRWVSQRGKNWFYAPLMRGRDEYQKAVIQAVNAGLEAIAKD